MKAADPVSRHNMRPCIPPSRSDPRFESLIRECWDDNPEFRPSFNGILRYLDDYSEDVLGPERDDFNPVKKYSFAQLCMKSWVKQTWNNAFNL